MGFEDENFRITPEAININDTRALRAVHLVRDALAEHGQDRSRIDRHRSWAPPIGKMLAIPATAGLSLS